MIKNIRNNDYYLNGVINYVTTIINIFNIYELKFSKFNKTMNENIITIFKKPRNLLNGELIGIPEVLLVNNKEHKFIYIIKGKK